MHTNEELKAIRSKMDGSEQPGSPGKVFKGYPKVKGGRRIYVRYPVQIQELDLGKTVIDLTIGKWMAVDVHLPEGYTRLIAPVQFDTEEECQKSCDAHNKYHKFTKKQALAIVSESMSASLKRTSHENKTV